MHFNAQSIEFRARTFRCSTHSSTS